MTDFLELLRSNPYPGRGIAVGRGRVYYFIMGRSENSRNRVFVETPDGIRTEAHDPAKLSDPSLIIYHPVRKAPMGLVVTNGDQTDTIVAALEQGGDMEAALETREFEPDPPNLTPRISAQLCLGCADGLYRYKLSSLKSEDAAGTACTRHYFRYVGLAGLGHFIHTYVTDGAPIPTFVGEPERVSIPDDIDAFTADIWDNLDADNRISLYVCYTDLATGARTDRLINKYD